MPTGWVGSNRARTLPKDWPARVAHVLRRDARRCQWVRTDTGSRCLGRARDVDHIISHADGGTDDYSNLQALCPYHHGKKSGREGGLASGRSRAATAAAKKPLHPGLIPLPPMTASKAQERGSGPAPF